MEGVNGYALLPLEDYTKLKQIANTKAKDCTTQISADDLIFLNSVIVALNPTNCELEICKNTVTIKAEIENGFINTSFDISLCKKYYNRVSKFIGEVL